MYHTIIVFFVMFHSCKSKLESKAGLTIAHVQADGLSEYDTRSQQMRVFSLLLPYRITLDALVGI